MKKQLKNLALVAIAALATVQQAAFAVGPDFSDLTGAVDFSTVGTAILAIGALLAVPSVVKRGTKIVLGMIGR